MKLPVLRFALFPLFVAAAYANTIDFENTPSGVFLTGTITQAGFQYSTYSGSVYIDGYGTYIGAGASHDLSSGLSGGVAQFAAVSGQFSFSSLDFAVSEYAETITLTGYRGGAVVGTDSYTLPGQAVYITPYYYTKEFASNLAGVTLDSLLVTLPRTGAFGSVGVDNIVLNPVANTPPPVAFTPEAPSFVLLGSGLLAAAGAIRRRVSRA